MFQYKVEKQGQIYIFKSDLSNDLVFSDLNDWFIELHNRGVLDDQERQKVHLDAKKRLSKLTFFADVSL